MNGNVILATFAAFLIEAGCQDMSAGAEAGSACASSEAQEADACDIFTKALATCRFLHTGKGSRRTLLPPTEYHVMSCLRERGWLPSGAPLPPDSEADANDPI